jgi:hypothetical protein
MKALLRLITDLDRSPELRAPRALFDRVRTDTTPPDGSPPADPK